MHLHALAFNRLSSTITASVYRDTSINRLTKHPLRRANACKVTGELEYLVGFLHGNNFALHLEWNDFENILLERAIY